MRIPSLSFVTLVVGLLVAASCGGSSSESTSPEPTDASDTGGVRVVTPGEAATIQTEPPADLVVLDVRTPAEFADGHLEGATMLDFYADDFSEQLAELDRDVPYLLYCRSGNRSGQTRALMEDLGFSDVADVDGGILAWADAGLPIVGP